METTSGGITPESARAALRDAQHTESAIRGVRTPWWYFVLSAALFAAMILTQLLDHNWNIYMTVVALAIVVLSLVSARRSGVMGAATRNRGFLACVCLIGVVIVGSILAYQATGLAWTVVVAAALAAALMLVGGRFYRRNPS